MADGTAGGCGPGAGADSRQFYESGTSPGGGATTESPREGRTPGAIALVGAQAYSANTERQRAARGAVSCPLPAPDGYNLAPWWLPRRENRGSGGGGIKTRSVFRDAVPRWRFAYFADAGKVGRPAGRNHPHPARRRNIQCFPAVSCETSGRMISAPTKGSVTHEAGG